MVADAQAGAWANEKESVRMNNRRGSIQARRMCVSVVLASMMLAGCANCHESVCRVVSKVAIDISIMRELCCETPEMDGCDQLVLIIPQLTRLIIDLQEACENENWNRLRTVWEEFKSLPWQVPYLQRLIRVLCDENEVDRGINSWPFSGPNDLFEFAGTFEAVGPAQPVVILPGSIEDVWLGPGASRRVQLGEPNVVWEQAYALNPGATLNATTWIGSAECSLTGSFSLISRTGSSEIDPLCNKELKRLDLRVESDSIEGSLIFDPSIESTIVVDAAGVGYLGAAVFVDVVLKSDPSVNAEGLADVLWIEIPVSIDGESIVLGPNGAVDGLDLFPVSSVLESRIRSIQLNAIGEGDCAETGDRAFNRFIRAYPECFNVNGE
jgi:hypothetical protein